jgi:hypothetical protein
LHRYHLQRGGSGKHPASIIRDETEGGVARRQAISDMAGSVGVEQAGDIEAAAGRLRESVAGAEYGRSDGQHLKWWREQASAYRLVAWRGIL